MLKILIPGGAGYIGSVLSRKLLNIGHTVNVIDNFMYNQESFDDLIKNAQFKVIKDDILNYQLINNEQ